MNYYIVAVNENGLGEELDRGISEKLIRTEKVLEDRTQWTSPFAPNLDHKKRIDELEADLDAKKAANITARINSIQTAARAYALRNFPTTAASIGLVKDAVEYPLSFDVKTKFFAALTQHVADISASLEAGESVLFNLDQFTTEITENQILIETGLLQPETEE